MKLAISTCPNDTFAFHAILNKKIDLRGLDFEIELLDIEQLNRGLLQGKFDIAKASFYAALLLAESTIVLPSGSALGFGVGPLVLAAEENKSPHDLAEDVGVTLCPGELTTATLLFKMFYATPLAENRTRIKQVVFSEIMPALRKREAAFGVCIHEGRFTWEREGLALVEDLGERWESKTGQPLPLGGLLARRVLPREQVLAAQEIIRASIEYGLENREETLPTMRRYAQEFDDAVLMQHVDLYVNPFTIELGDAGRRALETLQTYAVKAGAIAHPHSLEVFR